MSISPYDKGKNARQTRKFNCWERPSKDRAGITKPSAVKKRGFKKRRKHNK